MSNFTLGFKTQIINSNKQNVARFFKKKENGFEFIGSAEDFTGDASDALTMAAKIAAADRMIIEGFAVFNKGSVKSAIGGKGIEGQETEVSITFGTNAPAELQEFEVRLTLKSLNMDSELARFDSNFERTFYYPLIVKPSDSPAAIIARFEKTILEEGFQERPYFKIVSKTATTIVIRTNGVGQEIKVTATGTAVTFGKVTVSSSVTKPGYLGRNNFESLKGYRPETDATLQPLNYNDIKRQGLPVPGALYSAITLDQSFERNELHGSTMVDQDIAGSTGFELFINETLTQYLLAVTSWINANVPIRQYFPATSADEAVASPETVEKFTEVSQAPFTTGLG